MSRSRRIALLLGVLLGTEVLALASAPTTATASNTTSYCENQNCNSIFAASGCKYAFGRRCLISGGWCADEPCQPL